MIVKHRSLCSARNRPPLTDHAAKTIGFLDDVLKFHRICEVSIVEILGEKWLRTKTGFPWTMKYSIV